MADIDLTQAEADHLIGLEKIKANDDETQYLGMGGAIIVPLISQDKRENFLLDIRRGRIDLLKGTYQTRAQQIVVLVRLDFGGAPHRNPDDVDISCPHLHLYREGYGDKWAFPVPTERFAHLGNLPQTLDDFMDYCNVTDRPNISRGLFP
jgi:hypothetical protein